MNRVQQYLPGFVDPFAVERDTGKADSLEELMAIPWVAHWKDDPTFHRFSVGSEPLIRPSWDFRGPGVRALMAELDEGRKWWVVAGLESPDIYGLPVWEKKR